MNARGRGPVAAALLALASATTVTGAPPDARGAGAPCAPLEVEAHHLTLAAGGRGALHVLGGSGYATLALPTEAGGAVLDPGGALHAGPRPAAFDVTATDTACGTSAVARVDVVPALEVAPRFVRLTPGESFAFAIRGGAGAVHARLLGEPPGATLGDDGAFRAPAREGRWRALVTDEGSDREITLTIEVSARRAPFRTATRFVGVPRGARGPLLFRGGSGAVDLALDPPAAGRVERDDAGDAQVLLAADAPPSVHVRATDRLTRENADAWVVVAAPLGDPPAARGTRTRTGDVAVGDVNGDGRPDLIVGHAERARAGTDAGGLLVFYGTPDGFGAAPDLVVEGDHAGDRFGGSLLVRDVTGDGVDDVLVAAPDADLGASDRGAVYLFVGARAGLTSSPARVLAGESAHDRFGTAIAARDVNGDGSVDLVVSAPGARARGSKCEGGRAYVFRGESNARGVFEAVPWQTLELRDPLSDDAEAPVPCGSTPLEAGAALALLDLDADGALDLAVGEPRAAFRSGTQWQGAVDVYRGGRDGMFPSAPTWAVHLDRAVPASEGGVGGALDVVRGRGGEALVVRGRAGNSDGLWSFLPGALGPPVPGGPAGPRTRVVTTKVAAASYVGRVRGDAAVGDLDGDGRDDYVVTDPTDATTRLLAFHAADLSQAAPLRPFAHVVTATRHDATGQRIALWSGGEPASGLALFAPERTTSRGPFVGAIDVVTPSGPSPLEGRLAARRTIELPNVGAGDRTGASVSLVRQGAALRALIGAPGSGADALANAGRIERYDAIGPSPLAPLVGDREGERLGASRPVAVDFDGDGRPEIAVADALTRSPALAADEVDPGGCLARPGVRVGSGTVHVYAADGERWVERARVIAQDARGLPYGFGAAVAAADLNGDRKGDLVVGRADGGAIEVVLGRPLVPGKVVVACREDGGKGASLVYPGKDGPFEPKIWWAGLGARVASIGDVDGDGCDDVAFSIAREGNPEGVVLAFGFDASRARCRGHDRPLVLHLVSNDLAWPDDPSAPFQGFAIENLVARKGGVSIADGGADLTGDGVPDLAYGDAFLNDASGSGPAVEIVSGAFLASVCPDHRCPRARRPGVHVRGDSVVVALSSASRADRRILRGGPLDRGFGASLAVADLDGDGHADLAVGAPAASDVTAFAGSVAVYRGPLSASDPRPDPWLLAVGDARERSAFGEAIAVARSGKEALLLVGAPRSDRGDAGDSVGAAYVFPFPAATR